ncbi:hypothetical protein [Pseudoblastomonas halimionae]|uniref:hypothetical protein n=1 Tax=Alteriqipengyuania halimionae TaxID=1926630 RepID=UPI00136DFA36|nr:hypothetical protein [Alteriqipengyuania halimionae]
MLAISEFSNGPAPRQDQCTTESSAPSPDSKTDPIRVAVAGLGTVGAALVRAIEDDPRFELTAVLVRDPARARAVKPKIAPITDAAAFAASEADIFVDALSSDEVGLAVSRAVLARGKSLASASKRVIDAEYVALAQLARDHGAQLRFSAAVGGGAPVLETVAEARSAGNIARIDAVLNGTLNYLLHEIERGTDFQSALETAQAAGLAEADPTNDLSGADATAKSRIVAAEAFGHAPDDYPVMVEPLTPARAAEIAASGVRYVQACVIKPTCATVSLVPADGFAGDVPDGEGNVATIALEGGQRFSCHGPGAGGEPTAEAIMGDLRAIAAELAR